MTDERKPKVIVELREQFHRENEPTAEEAAELWRRIAERQENEEHARERRWAIEHAGAPVQPTKFCARDLPLYVAGVAMFVFAFVEVLCGGAS